MNTRKFGIEIEAHNVCRYDVAEAIQQAGVQARAEGYNHGVRTYWKVITDASLSGRDSFELVSPILEGEAGVTEAIKAVKAVREAGARVNGSCGFHVHIDCRDLSLKQIKNVIKSYANNEDIFDALMPASRRGNRAHYTGSMIGNNAEASPEIRLQATKAFFEMVDGCTTVQQLANLITTRYKKLNVHSFLQYGTLEFRHHSGTVNETKVANWVNFCAAFVEHAATTKAGIRAWAPNRMTTTERLRTVLRMLDRTDLLPYYTARIKELKRNSDAE